MLDNLIYGDYDYFRLIILLLFESQFLQILDNLGRPLFLGCLSILVLIKFLLFLDNLRVRLNLSACLGGTVIVLNDNIVVLKVLGDLKYFLCLKILVQVLFLNPSDIIDTIILFIYLLLDFTNLIRETTDKLLGLADIIFP